VEAEGSATVGVAESHGPVLADLGERLTNHVRKYVPSAEVALEPTAASFSIEPPKVEVLAGEDQDLTDLGRQGHGFRRAFVISALEYLAETVSGDETTERPTLFLAIEEPELYQHPPRARHFYRTLATVASEPSVQVCYATHSPYFVSADRFDALRIFRRPPSDGTPAAEVTAAKIDAVTDKLPENAKDPRAYLRRTLSEQFREAFFAKAVLLAEGDSDAAMFEAAAKSLGQKSLEADGIVTTNVGGKGCQPLALAILGALRIPAFCVFDADADATNGDVCPTCGRGKTNRTAAIASNKKLLSALGAEETEFPETTVSDTWACFHKEIEDAIPGFRSSVQEVSRELGWSGKSPEAYAEVIGRMEPSEVPDELRQILDRVRALPQPGPK